MEKSIEGTRGQDGGYGGDQGFSAQCSQFADDPDSDYPELERRVLKSLGLRQSVLGANPTQRRGVPGAPPAAHRPAAAVPPPPTSFRSPSLRQHGSASSQVRTIMFCTALCKTSEPKPEAFREPRHVGNTSTLHPTSACINVAACRPPCAGARQVFFRLGCRLDSKIRFRIAAEPTSCGSRTSPPHIRTRCKQSWRKVTFATETALDACPGGRRWACLSSFADEVSLLRQRNSAPDRRR